MGRHEEAIVHYREALRLDPENGNTHHTLAESLQALGRLEEAEREYREAISLDPDHPEAPACLEALLVEMNAKRSAG